MKIGIGVIYDGIAVKDATVLLKDAQAAVKQVSFSVVGQIKDIISISQFVVTENPTQGAVSRRLAESSLIMQK